MDVADKEKKPPTRKVSFDLSDLSDRIKKRQRAQSARPATERKGYKESQRQKTSPVWGLRKDYWDEQMIEEANFEDAIDEHLAKHPDDPLIGVFPVKNEDEANTAGNLIGKDKKHSIKIMWIDREGTITILFKTPTSKLDF